MRTTLEIITSDCFVLSAIIVSVNLIEDHMAHVLSTHSSNKTKPQDLNSTHVFPLSIIKTKYLEFH